MRVTDNNFTFNKISKSSSDICTSHVLQTKTSGLWSEHLYRTRKEFTGTVFIRSKPPSLQIDDRFFSRPEELITKLYRFQFVKDDTPTAKTRSFKNTRQPGTAMRIIHPSCNCRVGYDYRNCLQDISSKHDT